MENPKPNPYGYELLIDLKNCNEKKFSRKYLNIYFLQICELIDMQLCEVHFWDDVGVDPEEQQTEPHTKGTSAVCFILTSSIVIHTLDLLESVYVNIFSCKDFDPQIAEDFTKRFFEAKTCKSTFLERT